MLVPKRTLSAALSGAGETVYTDIGEATLQADDDPMVREIAYRVNSPGGAVDGCDFTAQIIAGAKKPTTAYVYDNAASAAYYLASQADRIVATSRGSRVGSIGVVTEIFDHREADGKRGVKRTVITNSDSKGKRPDVATEEGYKAVQEELDDIYSVFEERVVEGRSNNNPDFTAEDIRTLNGGMLIAKKALAAGLIDEAPALFGAKPKQETVPVGDEDIFITREESMNLSDFLEKNPEAKADVDALVAQKAEAMKPDEAKIRADAIAKDRENQSKLLVAMGFRLSDEQKAVFNAGKDAGAYALTVLEREQAKAPKPNANAIGGVDPAPEPKEEAQAAADADKYAAGRVGLDSLYDKEAK